MKHRYATPFLLLYRPLCFNGPVKLSAEAANWHENAFFGLHYDLHPGATDTELGRGTATAYPRNVGQVRRTVQ